MALSEEALESKQKSARNIRKFRCYQGHVMKNLMQAHQTMQLQSDMYLNQPYQSRNYNVSLIAFITKILSNIYFAITYSLLTSPFPELQTCYGESIIYHQGLKFKHSINWNNHNS